MFLLGTTKDKWQKSVLAHWVKKKGRKKHGFWYLYEHFCPQSYKFKYYLYDYNVKCSTQQKPKNFKWKICPNIIELNCLKPQTTAAQPRGILFMCSSHHLSIWSTSHVKGNKENEKQGFCLHRGYSLVGQMDFFSPLFIFNWRINALQYCVGFCHTSRCISHRYTYVPSLWKLPPTSHPIPHF